MRLQKALYLFKADGLAAAAPFQSKIRMEPKGVLMPILRLDSTSGQVKIEKTSGSFGTDLR